MLLSACCRKSTLGALTLMCYHGDVVINQEADRQKEQPD